MLLAANQILCSEELTVKKCKFHKNTSILETFTPVAPPRNDCDYTVKRENPPYNGWGSDEDSLANCYNLIPRPPKRTFEVNCSVEVLRFAAHLIAGADDDGNCGDKETTRRRIFIISCFLRDNTFMVYEPPVTNSGKTVVTEINISRIKFKANSIRLERVQATRVESSWNGAKL